MTLLLWIIAVGTVGFLLLFYLKNIRFYRIIKVIIPTLICVCIPFLIWNYYAYKKGVWEVNDNFLSGSFIAGVPIESNLYFVVIPFFFISIYELIKHYFTEYKFKKAMYLFGLIFTITSLIIGIYYREYQYTFAVVLGTGTLNWIIYFGFTPKWYSQFVIAFLFFLVLKTISLGVFTENLLIWHNSLEITGLTFLSVSLEEFYFMFFLNFITILFYKWIDKKIDSPARKFDS